MAILQAHIQPIRFNLIDVFTRGFPGKIASSPAERHSKQFDTPIHHNPDILDDPTAEEKQSAEVPLTRGQIPGKNRPVVRFPTTELESKQEHYGSMLRPNRFISQNGPRWRTLLSTRVTGVEQMDAS
ncbi:MAG: hypothetical protein JNL67_22665 [Planctomycetaceae bacterium]|nr:hypothetical protein [Planctomycetaceae bacterium]